MFRDVCVFFFFVFFVVCLWFFVCFFFEGGGGVKTLFFLPVSVGYKLCSREFVLVIFRPSREASEKKGEKRELIMTMIKDGHFHRDCQPGTVAMIAVLHCTWGP